ncbi:MAG TPA: class I SAM-dependent methyltransferase [Caulobacteraceae bacterium]|nr:class I SAM-dependent methyltransferase [Caulobacteraceae bacterium]
MAVTAGGASAEPKGARRAESKGGGVIGLYRRHAGAWARDRGDRLTERAWLDRFRELLPANPSVLDLGCALTGVDASAELIAMCRRDFPEHAWRVGDMRRANLGASFGGVPAWDSFFHLGHADQRRMFDRFRRHCAPGAALMFTCGPAHGEAIGAFEGEPLYHASLAPDEYRALLAERGFEVLAHAAEDPDCTGRTVWLARGARP